MWRVVEGVYPTSLSPSKDNPPYTLHPLHTLHTLHSIQRIKTLHSNRRRNEDDRNSRCGVRSDRGAAG